MKKMFRRLVVVAALAVAAGAALAQSTSPVYIVTHYDVVPFGQAVPAGVSAATLLSSYAAAALLETGVTSVRVLTDKGRASRFTVVEVWATPAAYAAHATAASTTQLRGAIAPWLVSPADVRTHVDFH
jgi:quinol monooxygenase YgiN